ncbi:hypothetical protein LNTAR_00555 [Lentisphaera araneosa HTCC2155]|uniref:Uncharacterized protein n=1 Tax=Lentisphaera araneosa HTCC2155 TaxID=313628 RepID=A6DKE8_9BACT|nr:hypothetical protein [Lentisphaera araneosa]EDM27846.1 hypothetical protein LNTAR_00555 [Lentisphaera araneosa HTCC2155]
MNDLIFYNYPKSGAKSPSRLVKDWQILAGRAREGQRPSRMQSIMTSIQPNYEKFYT